MQIPSMTFGPPSPSSPHSQPRGRPVARQPRSIPLARLFQRHLSAVPEEDAGTFTEPLSASPSFPVERQPFMARSHNHLQPRCPDGSIGFHSTRSPSPANKMGIPGNASSQTQKKKSEHVPILGASSRGTTVAVRGKGSRKDMRKLTQNEDNQENIGTSNDDSENYNNKAASKKKGKKFTKKSGTIAPVLNSKERTSSPWTSITDAWST